MKNLLLIVFITLVGCDKGAKTPEGLIKKFVETVTNGDADKAFIEKYTTGELWGSVEDFDVDEFKKDANLNKVKNAKVEISNKICAGEKCTVTYLIKYDVVGEKTKSFETEVKKVATVIREGEFWKVESVTNIKTFHDASQAIEITDKKAEQNTQDSKNE